MNIEKVLKEIIHVSESPYMIRAACQEALAELSKQSGDDALKLAYKLREDVEDIGIMTVPDKVLSVEESAELLQQFAIEYHAKQCAWCKVVHFGKPVKKEFYADMPDAENQPLPEPPEATI